MTGEGGGPATPRPGARDWVLARRSLADCESDYYICYGPAPARTTLGELLGVAGRRRAIAECFQAASAPAPAP